MSGLQPLAQHGRLLTMAALVAVAMVAVYYNNIAGGSLGIDKTLTIAGITKSLLFYAAVFGFISLSRSGVFGSKGL